MGSSELEFHLLGPLEVLAGGRALDLGGQKQRALLALLVLEANRPILRERLIDALWEDDPTPTAAKALQVYVSQLRKVLGHERVITQSGGYTLRAEPGEIDLARFQRLVADGNPREALALWRGPPLGEFAGQRFAQAEIARLEALRLRCLEAQLEAELAEGRDVVGELEALVAQHPLRERLRELLLLALYRSGRQADALAAFREARRALVEELGIEPGKPLRDLHQAILRQDSSLDREPSSTDQPRGAFVGRAAEVDLLVEGLDDAIAGRGCVFLLVGEPGIGKSRLAEELTHLARARRVEVLVGRCWEAGGAPAYWPWVQSLRAIGAESLLESQRAADDVGARFRLFDATARFLCERSQLRPLLIFLDDLHAADEPSLLLLRFLARAIGSARIFVLGACRDVDPVVRPPLAETLAELAREPLTRRLSLTGLTESAVADYLSSTASELASAELVSALYEETEGNPLFVVETVRLFRIEGRIELPAGVRDVIARRLFHLGDDCHELLRLAAVLGREFDHTTLAAMGSVPVEEMLETLDEAMGARILTDVPGSAGRSRFAHVLIRDVLYDGLTHARRIQLHRRAADVLEDDAELAHHAAAGNLPARAVMHARRAGERAFELHAYEEAARLYELALACSPDETTRCELLLSLGHAQVRSGDNENARKGFLEAAASARRLRHPDALARAALGYGGRFVWARAGRDDRLVPLLEEAFAAGDELAPELRVQLLARLSAALRDDPDVGPREQLSRQAVDLARSLGDPATLAYALTGRYAAIWSPATAHERLALATEGVELAHAIGAKEREVENRGHRIHALLELGRLDEADADLEARAALTAEMGQPAQVVVHLWIRSMRHLLVGDLDSAETDIHHAFDLARRLSLFDEASITFELQRYVLRREQGRVGEVEGDLKTCANSFPNRPVLRCALANLSAELGRIDEAREALASIDIKGLPFHNEWIVSVSLLAETCVGVGDTRRAADLYELLMPYADQIVADGTEVALGAVARHLGLLAETLGRPDDAARHFEHAALLHAQMGVRSR